MAKCETCFRKCEISEGMLGFCGARTCRNGHITAANYGRVTSLSLDPIEKKPLYHFYPGSNILSVGSYGCNLRCPFCQNSEISWSEAAFRYATEAEVLTPQELLQYALACKSRGNIGLAFTYNEPLIGWEFLLDTAKLIQEAGMKAVLVTNGTASLPVLETLAPYIDAMNIDLKGYSENYYKKILQGDRQMVMDFIRRAVQVCHVELTTLIIPGENDSEKEMSELSAWVAGLDHLQGGKSGRDIPLHVSRFFPRFHMTDRPPTDISLVYHLADVARRNLRFVHTGNC